MLVINNTDFDVYMQINNVLNAQLSEILNEMKQATLAQEEKLTIESKEDAIAQVEGWQDDLKLVEKQLQDRYAVSWSALIRQ